MPLPRFSRLDPERQRAILEAAADEFAEHGPDRASVNAILGAAEMSKGQFYYYFADKADLFGAVIAREVDALFACLEPLDAVTDADAFWRGVEEQILVGVERMQSRPRAGRLLRGLYRSDAPSSATIGLLTQFSAWLDGALAVGARVGAVRADVPPELVAAMVLGAGTAADRWFAEHMEDLAPDALVRLSVATTQMVRGMVAPPG